MRSENFVAFFTVCGFFIGSIFSVIKIEDSIEFLISTLVITLFFYLFIHVVLILFLTEGDVPDNLFDVNDFEENVNTQIKSIKNREDKITYLLKSINQVNDNDIQGAKQQ